MSQAIKSSKAVLSPKFNRERVVNKFFYCLLKAKKKFLNFLLVEPVLNTVPKTIRIRTLSQKSNYMAYNQACHAR